MADAAREYFRYYGKKSDGSEVLLLDTLDFYSNHSAIAMHVVREMEDDVDFVIDRNVRKLFAMAMVKEENIAVATGYRLIIAMLVAYCLRKYKPFKILYVGSKLPAWGKGFDQLLREFHPDSRLYWLTQTDTRPENYCIGIKMLYAELLLPQKTFDIVVLDDKDETLLTSMRENVILSLRIQGRIILLSKRPEIMDVFLGPVADRYELGASWQTGHRLLTAEERKAIEADTMDGSVAVIVQEVLQRVTLAQEALLSADADLDVLLQTAEDAEQYILLSYATLPSLEVKYLVNEWKRALLECRLGWGSTEKARRLGEALLAALQQ